MLIALGLIALALLLGAGPAGAHTAGLHLSDLHAREGGHSAAHVVLPHGWLPPTGLPIGGLLAVGLALLAGLVLWRLLGSRFRGRALVVALSLVLATFAFETAFHSVHHLADPGSGASCPVLSGSQNLSWGAAELAGADSLPLVVTAAPPVRSEDSPRWRLHRPSQGRAPPA
jgi:ABC-type branched-subunit amino acid transport system permease subunit